MEQCSLVGYKPVLVQHTRDTILHSIQAKAVCLRYIKIALSDSEVIVILVKNRW